MISIDFGLTGFLVLFSVPVGATVFLYFWPTILAFRKAHASRWGIFLLNLTLGWTTVGWLAVLVWALRSPTGNDGNPADRVSDAIVGDGNSIRIVQ